MDSKPSAMEALTKKLTSIQTNLKAPKGQYNSFGKYSYRNCEDILEAVKPLMNGYLLAIHDEIVQIGDRYYIKATVMFMSPSTEESVRTYGWARESEERKGMDESQITGAASSYARKYALNAMFLIDDTKDADLSPPKKEVISDEQARINKDSASIRKLLKAYKGEDKADIGTACKDAVKNKTFTEEFVSKIVEQLS